MSLRKAIEQVVLREGTEKMSSREVQNIIKKNKLKGSALPMFKVMGGKMVHMPFKSEMQSIGKPQMIRGKSPEDAAKTYTKMYKNPVMSVELDDDDWVNEKQMKTFGQHSKELEESPLNTQSIQGLKIMAIEWSENYQVKVFKEEFS